MKKKLFAAMAASGLMLSFGCGKSTTVTPAQTRIMTAAESKLLGSWSLQSQSDSNGHIKPGGDTTYTGYTAQIHFGSDIYPAYSPTYYTYSSYGWNEYSAPPTSHNDTPRTLGWSANDTNLFVYTGNAKIITLTANQLTLRFELPRPRLLVTDDIGAMEVCYSYFTR